LASRLYAGYDVKVPENVVTELERYLRKHNHFVEGFVMMKEEMEKEKTRARRNGEPERELKLLFSLKRDVRITMTY
jgi:ribosomal protein S6